MNPTIFQGALAMVGVNCTEQTTSLIIDAYKAVEAKGGKFDVETAIEIKGANLAKYNTEPIQEPKEIEQPKQNEE